MQKTYSLIIGISISLFLFVSIFLCYDYIKGRALRSLCNDVKSGIHISEVEIALKNYNWEEPIINYDNILSRLAFKATKIPFDFRVCIVEYHQETGIVTDSWYNHD